MRAALRTALCLLAICLPACAWMYPTAVPLRTQNHLLHPGRRTSTLLVLLPGRGDTAEDFTRHGFVDDVRASGAPVDLIALEAHFGYYLRESLVDRVYNDVLRPARQVGYRQIWLVGVSMGGLGAIAIARAHPESVDRLILLGPYLGPRDLVQAIARAGGAARWTATDPRNFYQQLWIWLQGYADPAAHRPEVTLGYGAADGLAQAQRMLGQLLPAGRTTEIDGGHAWVTWRQLWQRYWSPGGSALVASAREH